MARLQLRVPAKPKYARLVRERVLEFGMESGLGTTENEEFLTAIGEAFANAIEHAGSEEPIEIELRVDPPDKLVALVTDRGCGFSTSEARNELPPAGAERGRGLPLMRRYCDTLDVSSAPGRGTQIQLGRFLHRPVSGRTTAAS